MTPDDFRACLTRLGLSQVGAGVVLGVSDREVRRYAAGKAVVPKSIVILLGLYEADPAIMRKAPQ